MPYKDPEKQKAAQHAHYLRFKEKYAKSSRAERDYRNLIVNTAKDKPCSECGGEFHPAIMHFHHRDPATKSGTIGDLKVRAGRQVLLDEIAKCDVVCANCHGMLHVEERASRKRDLNS